MNARYRVETGRTFLREFVQTDADDVRKIFSDSGAMAFAPMRPTPDLSVAQDFVRWHLANYQRHGFSAWAVILKQTQAFVGQAGLIPQDEGTELFYSLVPAYWNQGLATEIGLACRDDAFETFGLRRLISIIHPDNRRAIRVALKVGMKQTGTIKKWGRDNALYEVNL